MRISFKAAKDIKTRKRYPFGTTKAAEFSTDGYREFTSDKDAEEWGHDRYGAWADNYLRTMRHIRFQASEDASPFASIPLERYCGYDYRHMNNWLRNGEGTEEIVVRSNLLNYLLLSTDRITENLLLWRHIPKDTLDMILDYQERYEHHFLEKGFLSTSLVKDSCARNSNSREVLLKIYAKTPLHGLYVNTVCRRDETELLIEPFTNLLVDPLSEKDENGSEVHKAFLWKDTII